MGVDESIRSFLLLLIESLLVELLDDAGGDLGETLLGVQGQQLPGQVQRVIQVSAFILALGDELMLELLQELQMIQVFLSECLHRVESTSSPMTAFIAAVSLAAA